MTVAALLWLDIGAAALLAFWLTVRFPSLGPKSLVGALVVFLAGQCAPTVGLWVLPAAVRLGHGPQLALIAVVLPVFVLMFLTIGWLMRACLQTIGGPRGGHRVRNVARSRA